MWLSLIAALSVPPTSRTHGAVQPSTHAVQPSTHTSDRKPLYVVAHHKSGTVASFNVVVSVCCRVAQNCDPPDEFWSYWDGEGHSPACKKMCGLAGVHINTDGFGPNFPFELLADATVLHFVREPADMVVSGYLYHLDAKEPQWTDTHYPLVGRRDPAVLANASFASDPPTWMDDWFGSAASFTQVLEALGETPASWNAKRATYSELLRAASSAKGLLAEAIRTTAAPRGVRKMLEDRESLARTGVTGTLLEICLDQISHDDPDYTRAWDEIARAARIGNLLLSPRWESTHATGDARGRGGLTAVARGMLHRLLPPRFVRSSSWPCAGDKLVETFTSLGAAPSSIRAIYAHGAPRPA